MRVVLGARSLRHFVSLFDYSSQQRFMGLFPVPWATAGGAQFRHDVTKLLKADSRLLMAVSWGLRFFAVSHQLFRHLAISNPPERAVRAELGDFAGGPLTDVNRDCDHTDKRAAKNQ